MSQPAITRQCIPSSSTIPRTVSVKRLSFFPRKQPESLPFFSPPFRSPISWNSQTGTSVSNSGGKGKGKATGGPSSEYENQVDDREWEIRVARAMLHLRDTLPHMFHPEQTSSKMFPPDIYSQNITFKLPHPFPVKLSGIAAYSMAYAAARNGMQALHTGLTTNMERLTCSPSPSQMTSASNPSTTLLLSRISVPAHRQKQIRIIVSVYGTPRLPPFKEAIWRTSSLYTFSPTSGLIQSHEVESIRPLPGEGVAEWLKARLLGWTHAEEGREGIACPRSVPLPTEAEVLRFLDEKRKKGGGL